MSFEENMQRLTALTEQLERGGLTLEETIRLHGEGTKLADACLKELQNATLTVSAAGQQNSTSCAEN